MKMILTLIVLISSLTALAAKPYGMAGCGWGSQVMGKDGNQVMAITTNETGTQTFAISSGTSNCVTATEQTARIRNFIEANYASLVTDMAKGQGDSLTTLSAMYGCEAGLFATEIKKNYQAVAVPTADATKMMVSINNVIEDSGELSLNCAHGI
jgi:hypothetical protein